MVRLGKIVCKSRKKTSTLSQNETHVISQCPHLWEAMETLAMLMFLTCQCSVDGAHALCDRSHNFRLMSFLSGNSFCSSRHARGRTCDPCKDSTMLSCPLYG